MKRKFSDRVLSLFLSLVMVFSSIPINSFATTSEGDETIVPDDKPNYYLFIDQQTEFGSILDVDETKEYIDIFEELDDEVIEPESEPNVEPTESKLLFKSSEYAFESEVNLKVNIEDGYQLEELIIQELVKDDEILPEDTSTELVEPKQVEYTYDEETNVVTFVIPEFDVLVSASFIEQTAESVDLGTPADTCTDGSHNYTSTKIDPTCTSDGFTTNVCLNCGDTYVSDEIKSEGHQYDEIITKEPTETEEGVKTFTCYLCGDSYEESVPVIKKEDNLIKNPAPNVSDLVDGESTTPDVYIRELSTQLFYGAELTKHGNVWDANYYNSGHRFSFRINYAISGVDTALENSIRFTIPRSILTTRENQRGDYYEMSIPSRAEVEAFLNGTGESIDNDVNFAYYENGDEIVIYNFRTLPAGYNGYIELSYFMNQSTYNYIDMAEHSPFTCTMTAPMNSMTAEPITVKINTTAKIRSVTKEFPSKSLGWNDSWGNNLKLENHENYQYLVWTIVSDITATQPYNFTLEDTISGNFDGMEVLGYKFYGETEFSDKNSISNQKVQGKRYDYVLTSIPLDIYGPELYWEANNLIKATVDPVDEVDEDTFATATKQWTWSKPEFKEPTGHFNGYKRADGAYRTYGMYGGNIFSGTVHKAPTLDFSASEYTRYDLETFNGYNGAGITNTTYSGFKYASWMVGYPYPWTYDDSYEDPLNPEAYGKIPVKYVFTDEGVYLGRGEIADVKLTSDDFKFVSVGYSWCMEDALLDEDSQSFKETPVTYTENDILIFYGKFGNSDEWVQIASYNVFNDMIDYNDEYISSMTSNNIVPKNDVDLVAYKIETSNAHYFTEIFTVPHLILKNSETVMNTIVDAPNITIKNNNFSQVFKDNGELIFSVAKKDSEFARASQKDSDIDKDIISVSNNPKKRTYTITWKITQDETVEEGIDGRRSFIPQNGGVFYDLLPEGAVLNKKTVDVQIEDKKFLSTSSYVVETIDNYKDTGRTMLIVRIKVPANYYIVYYDTVFPWNSIKDYGNDVYNPIAYETGNDTITKGFPDNGGRYFTNGEANSYPIKDAEIMSDLNPDIEDVGVSKYIYAQKYYDIAAITAASSGLMKKVKGEYDNNYSYETLTTINGNYSYQLRYMNSYTSSSKNMIFFDSLENYDYDTMRNYGTLSDWRGTLQSIDVNQLESKGIAPVIYYSTISKLDIEENHDITDTSIWDVLTESTDLSTVKAIAIDMRKTVTGKDFVLAPGESVVLNLHMKAPSICPEKEGGFAYTYNNVYISDTVFDPSDESSAQDFLIHQDYTTVKLYVTGNFGVQKVSVDSEDLKIKDIEFRLRGVSDYGTEIDIISVTDSNGQIYFEDVEKGTYILQEYKSTPDWLLDTTEHKVRIDNEGKTWMNNNEYTDSYITISNNPRIHGPFTFFKKELGDDTMSVMDTTFVLSGVSDYGTDVILYATSEVTGRVLFPDVELGTYELVEVKANKNYAINPIIYKVKIDDKGVASIIDSNEIDENGNSVPLEESVWFKNENGVYSIYNEYKFYEIELRKIDADNNTVFLEGATFTLTGVSSSGNKVDMSGTSDKNGYIAFNGIEQGVYVLKEVAAPKGVTANGNIGGTLDYMEDDTEYIVKVNSKDDIIIDGLEKEEGTGYFVVKNVRAYDKEIVITKIWEDDLTSEERIEQGLIPKLHLTTKELALDNDFHIHEWDEGVVVSYSTCSAYGEVLFTCSDCGMTHIEQQLKSDHNWGEWVVSKTATCTESGTKASICSVCNEIKTETIPILPHSWDEGFVKVKSTCSTTGEMIHECEGCKTTKSVTIETLPHTWDNGIVMVEPSCSANGSCLYTCTICEITETRPIDRLPHDYTAADGSCIVCGAMPYLYEDIVMQGTGNVTVTVSSNNYDYYNGSLRPYYSKIITFVPKESGTYTFTTSSSADTYGRLYNAKMSSLVADDDSGGSSQFKITYACTAGTVYYLAVGRYSTSSSATSIPVKITKN